MRGVVDYRAFNSETKKTSNPLTRSDESFYRIGEAKLFSIMNQNASVSDSFRPGKEEESYRKEGFQYQFQGSGLCSYGNMGLCNAP